MAVEGLPAALHWTSSDDAIVRDATDMICYSNFLSDQSVDVRWSSDWGEMLTFNALPSPARSVDSHQSATSQYRSFACLEDELAAENVSICKERRRVQNKKAQRAFRQRKETRLQELETKVTDLTADLRQLMRKHHDLRTEHLRLQSGLKALLDTSGTVDDNLAAMSATFEKEIKM